MNQLEKVKGWIEGATDRLSELIPQHVNKQRFIRNMTNQVMGNQQLVKCDPRTVIESCVEASNLGLEVGVLGSCYLVAYGSKCQLILGYRGMIELANRAGSVKSINVLEIREGDDIAVDETGRPLVHINPFAPGRDGRAMIGVVVSIELAKGGWQFTTMSKEQYEKTRPRYWQKGPHSTHPEEMWKKAAIRRAFKTITLTPEISEHIQKDDAVEHPEYQAEVQVTKPGAAGVLEDLKAEQDAPLLGGEEVDPDTGEVIPPSVAVPDPKPQPAPVEGIHLERANLINQKHKLPVWRRLGDSRLSLIKRRMRDLGLTSPSEFWDHVQEAMDQGYDAAYAEEWSTSFTLDLLLRVPQRGNTDHLNVLSERVAKRTAEGGSVIDQLWEGEE